MIFYGCPKCQNPMSSPDSMAGESETCPECGNVTVVSAPNAPSPVPQQVLIQHQVPPPPPPQQMHQPAAKPVSGGHGGILHKANPAMFRNHPMCFIVCLLLIFVGLIRCTSLGWELTSCAFLGLGIIALFIWWLHCKCTVLVISDSSTTLRTGILSKNTNEIRHIDVRNIQVRQGVFQRIFGVATIGISSAAQANIEIVISGIRNPQKVKDIVNQYRGQNN